MPVVLLKVNPFKINYLALNALSHRLPKIVAEALDVQGDPDPSCHFKAREIEVVIASKDPHKLANRGLGIIVVDVHPKVLANRAGRAQQIMDAVLKFPEIQLSGLEGYVYISPPPGTHKQIS